MRAVLVSSVSIVGLVAFALLIASCCRETERHQNHSEHSHGAVSSSASDTLSEGNPHAGYCPVMGGKVDKVEASSDSELHSDYRGKRYYFCCAHCKPEFEKDPEQWIASPAKPKEDGHHHRD